MYYRCNLQQPEFTVENIDILKVSHDAGYKHAFRNREKSAFLYVVSGALCDTFASFGGESIRIDAGELLFVPQGSVYSGTYLLDNTEVEIVQFDIAAGALPEYLLTPKKITLKNAAESIDAFFKPLKKTRVNHPFYYMYCLYELLWRIDDCYSGVPPKYKKLQAAITELLERSERNVPISYYASLCNMSEVNFRRLFREHTGQTPVEYRNSVRLQKARAALQSGEYNVSEAAEASGFSNLSFFIRLYKKKYGYTPKKE